MHFADMMSTQFLMSLFSIIMIDIVLAGDNSVVIAMAVQSLPPEKKLKGIILGALAAVLLRVLFTFFASQMLLMPFVKLVGGLLILWIAVKLMVDDSAMKHKNGSVASVWSAVWVILVADITMSLDNVLAVAGASHGSLLLLIFGLGLSIPLVVFASTMISRLMERYPAVVWIGALILGKVGGEMIVTDQIAITSFFSRFLTLELHNGVKVAPHWLIWCAEISGIAIVLVLSLMMRSKKKERLLAETGS